MTSYMNIMVRVVSGRAMAQMQALRAAQAGVTSGMIASNRVAPLGRAHISSLMKFGNQLQWTGRMIQYNFTLPLLAAGVAATKWALEQDKAMTHVAKVYGDVKSASAQFVKQSEGAMTQRQAEAKASRILTGELEALDDAFTAISNHYGIQKKEVLEVAGAWAAAGASGIDLAKSVDATMKAIIIGDMEAGAATKALISVQAQYNLSTQELMATLATLNSVENQTGASMADLIVGFEKAAGVARSAGVETRQLAAYMAALVPATGSASTAGQALKTIFSRLLGPTKESVQVMKAMGIQFESMDWQSASVTERLQIMAEKFEGLGAAQKNVVSAVVASRWQINKFDTLMRELVSTTGYYEKALRSSEDQGQSFKRMQEELNTVLESDPRRMQRMWVMLQNAMVEIIQPMIPFILYLADSLADLANKFAELDPHTQKLIIFGLTFLALVGPIVKYMGALTTLFAVFGVTLLKIGSVLLGFGGLLVSAFVTPMAMIGSLMLTSLGAISAMMIGFFTGLGTIAAAGWSAVNLLWGVGLAFMSSLSKIGWAAQLMVARTALALKLLAMKIFWVKVKVLWLSAQIFTATRWAAFWLVMKTVAIASMGSMVAFMKKFMVFMARALTVALGPWGIAIAAVLGILYAFRDQIKQVFGNASAYVEESAFSISNIFTSLGQVIHDVFNSLPQGVQNAMVAVVTVIRDAALAVYEWFSYINPFARHSPSLVDNVTNGMTAVQRQFGRLASIKGSLSAAYNEIKRFGKLTAGLGVSAAQQQQGEDRKAIKKAGGGAALGSYNKLTSILNNLQPILDRLEVKMNDQQRVVDTWQAKVDKANNKLDVQQSILQGLQGTLGKYQDKLSAAEDSLSSFASAPLEGMAAMEERIFRNSHAQNKLRLEMMRMEEVNGTFDDMKSKMDAINGAQELMRGEQSALRAAGAGSEILGQYDKEMSKLDEQKAKYVETADKLNDMQVQLDALQRQGEKLDLVKAMKFDELQFRIAQAAETMKEMSFEDIMAGIRGAKDEIAKYGPKVDEATAAVDRQQKVVDALTAARDRLQARLDREQATLEKITNKYNRVNDAISAINSTISDVVANADKMNQALAAKKDAKKKGAAGAAEYISPGLANFRAAGNADFPDPGGKGIPPRTNWKSQKDQIKKFTEQLGMDTAGMFESLNPFTPLKGKAIEAWNWIKAKAKNVISQIKDMSGNIFGDVGGSKNLTKAFDALKGAGKFVTKVIKDILKVVKWGWELFGEDFKKIGKEIWGGLKDIWKKIGPELAEFGKLFKPMGKAIKNIWTIAKPFLALLAGGFLAVGKVFFSVIANTIGPLLKNLGTILKGVIKVIRGVFEVIIGILTGDWKMAWKGVLDIVTGTFGAIWGVLKGAAQLIWGVVKGIAVGIYGFFEWLYDKLIGHSIIPDIIDGIKFWFGKLADLAKWLWNKVLKPVYNAFADLWNKWVKPAIKLWWAGIKAIWSALFKLGSWFWDNVLKPVWNKVKELWPMVKILLVAWWTSIKTVWNILKTLAIWVWENVLRPVISKVRELWSEHVGPALREWWGKIKTAWDSLKGAGMWVWDNVLSPVFEKFKTAFTAIREWMTDKLGWIVDPFKAVVRGIVGAINWIIKGINLLDKLPGVSISISTLSLPEGFDAGGIPKRKVGSGFKTNGARAIVGEGKANHPEFVIPTDPTHRRRAKVLLGMAAGKLGVPGVGASPKDIARAARDNPNGHIPKFGIGGWIGENAGDLIGDVIDLGKGALELTAGAVSNSMKPYIALARKSADSVDWDTGRQAAHGAVDIAESWTKLASDIFKGELAAVQPAPGATVAVTDPGNPGGRSIWKGGMFSNRFIAHMQKAEQLAGAGVYVMQGGFRPQTSYSGTSHQGDAVDFQVNNALIRSFRQVGIAAGDRTGLGDWSPHVHAVPGPGAGYAAGSGTWQFQDYMARGGASQAYTSPWGLKDGAIIKARRGGVLARIGEGSNDEAVTPLPRNWQAKGLGGLGGGGGVTNNFYGNLEFPNVKDGSDAEEFLKNLEILSKD